MYKFMLFFMNLFTSFICAACVTTSNGILNNKEKTKNEKQQQQDERDIEQVIFDIAEYKKDEDYNRLYELLANRILFLPVDPASLPKTGGYNVKIRVDSSMPVLFKLAQGPNGENLVPSLTTPTSSMIQEGYVGIEWFEYLHMALKMPSISGVLIQGKTSLIIIYKKQIKNILNEYKR